MRILLVNPPVGFSYYNIGLQRPPLSLAYLAAMLVDKHSVSIVDFNVGKDNWKKYRYGDYDVVGISVDTARYPVSLKIARHARNQGAKVVMGGPHVTFLDDETLASGVVDYVVRNEGEHSFKHLIDFLSGDCGLEVLQGISYLSAGRIVRTPDTPFITDLDSLPFPKRDLLHLEYYNEKMNGRPMTTLITSRGCPFNCNFCASSEFFGVRWRARSVENIIEEIELLYEKYGYRALCFVEDNFTLDPNRAIALSEAIIARGWDLIWEAWSRVDTIVKHPEMIRTMARAGFRWTFIGFESGSQEVLDGYGKKALIQDALHAMEILNENNVRATGAFILGAMNETKKTADETISFARTLNPVKVQFSILTPYPGTKLFERVQDNLLTNDWGRFTALNPIIRLDKLTPGQLSRRLLKAYTSFYLRPRKAIENMRIISNVLPGLFKWSAPRIGHLCLEFSRLRALYRWIFM
ncbi:MAG TPA: radical SAM protein [Patescibacteria group bacterium]|nr:radical SAM protein [Patescibacteria group bacterium]